MKMWMGVLSVIASGLAWGSESPRSRNESHPCASNHIIVRFRREAFSEPTRRARKKDLARLEKSLELPGAQIEETPLARIHRKSKSTALDPARHVYVRLPRGLEPAAGVARLRDHPLVEYAELDHVVHGSFASPNDPDFGTQWHLFNPSSTGVVARADIHALEAWGITTGSTDVVVAVLDSGITASLPEFAGRLLPGYDFANNDSDPTDDDDISHGTAISAIIAANANNALQIAGIDWRCKIRPVKVLNRLGDALASWYADGIDWARTHGCHIINFSTADYVPNETVARAISNAVAAGIVFVGVADNDGTNRISFPGNLTNIITVGATDRNDQRATFSNFGPQLDLVAPGVHVPTLNRAGAIFPGSGTSVSAPMVSGIAALLLAARPGLSVDAVRTLLCAGADDQVGNPAEDTPGFDEYYGWGRVNAFNSLVLATTRIRLFATTNEQFRLSWTCPPNAATKRPYRLETATAPDGPWTPVADSTNIVCTAAQAAWMGSASATNGSSQFFRLRIVAE